MVLDMTSLNFYNTSNDTFQIPYPVSYQVSVGGFSFLQLIAWGPQHSKFYIKFVISSSVKGDIKAPVWFSLTLARL